MRPVFLFTVFILVFETMAISQTAPILSVAQCRALAVQNSPLQGKKDLATQISNLQIRNLKSNSLPRIQFGAQASWQSDVFGLPFKFPGSDIPEVPKDQYKLSADIAQRIWDGGTDRQVRQQREIEQDLATAQVEVDAFGLREIVTDLYFKALLLQESKTILESSKKDLETRLKQAEAAVAEGTALKTTADQIKIQILKTDQQIAGTQADYQTILDLLEKWVGQKCVPVNLVSGNQATADSVKTAARRPEYTLFELQQRNLMIGKNALGLRVQPKIEAFLQAGLGRPNPFNFFETGFKPFAMLGIRAAWTPIDWGNIRRDKQVLDLQMKNIDLQRQFFDQRLEANTLKDRQEEAKWTAQMAQDDAILKLQMDIIRRAEAQVQNGVMTMTDYLSQLNLLTQAMLTRKTHEIQAVQSWEMQQARLGN
jgi:outer membrane protein TolC